MTADPFGCCMHDHICSMFERPEKIATSTKSIINNQGQIMLLCYRGYFVKIGNTEARVADRFYKDCFCFFINLLLNAFCGIVFSKSCFYSQTLESNRKLIISTTI